MRQRGNHTPRRTKIIPPRQHLRLGGIHIVTYDHSPLIKGKGSNHCLLRKAYFNLKAFSIVPSSALNILSVFNRFSTCVQLWMTVL